ncbi:MAG: hypothetical protein N4A61_05290 [Pelagimonas sp.]|jgi:hypothetical protein|nr:hypothetical protein [Pelagimonas sp.]
MSLLVGFLLLLLFIGLPLSIFVMMQVRAIRSHGKAGKRGVVIDAIMLGMFEGPLTSLLLAEPKAADELETLDDLDLTNENGFGGGYIMPSETRNER